MNQLGNCCVAQVVHAARHVGQLCIIVCVKKLGLFVQFLNRLGLRCKSFFQNLSCIFFVGIRIQHISCVRRNVAETICSYPSGQHVFVLNRRIHRSGFAVVSVFCRCANNCLSQGNVVGYYVFVCRVFVSYSFSQLIGFVAKQIIEFSGNRFCASSNNGVSIFLHRNASCFVRFASKTAQNIFHGRNLLRVQLRMLHHRGQNRRRFIRFLVFCSPRSSIPGRRCRFVISKGVSVCRKSGSNCNRIRRKIFPKHPKQRAQIRICSVFINLPCFTVSAKKLVLVHHGKANRVIHKPKSAQSGVGCGNLFCLSGKRPQHSFHGLRAGCGKPAGRQNQIVLKQRFNRKTACVDFSKDFAVGKKTLAAFVRIANNNAALFNSSCGHGFRHANGNLPVRHFIAFSVEHAHFLLGQHFSKTIDVLRVLGFDVYAFNVQIFKRSGEFNITSFFFCIIFHV